MDYFSTNFLYTDYFSTNFTNYLCALYDDLNQKIREIPTQRTVNPALTTVNAVPTTVNAVPTTVNTVPTTVNAVPTIVNPVPTYAEITIRNHSHRYVIVSLRTIQNCRQINAFRIGRKLSQYKSHRTHCITKAIKTLLIRIL
jgi:hypothetical protein